MVAQVFLGLQQHISSICPHLHLGLPTVSLPSHGVLLCVSVSFSYKDSSLIRLWLTLIQNDFILIWLCLQRPYFQIRSHAQVLGVKTLIYPLLQEEERVNTIQPISLKTSFLTCAREIIILPARYGSCEDSVTHMSGPSHSTFNITRTQHKHPQSSTSLSRPSPPLLLLLSYPSLSFLFTQSRNTKQATVSLHIT